QLIADLACAPHEPVDSCRRERREKCTSRVLVARRIICDRRRAAAARRHEITHDHLTGREIVVIEGDGTHILVARGQVDAVIPLRVSDGAFLTQVLPNGIGILDPSTVEVVEIATPIHDRPTLCHGETPSRTAGYLLSHAPDRLQIVWLPMRQVLWRLALSRTLTIPRQYFDFCDASIAPTNYGRGCRAAGRNERAAPAPRFSFILPPHLFGVDPE